MFLSAPLTIAADAILVELGVCQLASYMPFEGEAQRDALKTLTLMQFATVKLQICAKFVCLLL
jgi:hypothetical protein